MDTERYATTQQAAQRLGLKYYYTGRPCPQGHYSERYAHSRECMACNRTDYAEKPRRAPVTITQRPMLDWAAGWAREPEDPYKGWAPELREREERRLAGCGLPLDTQEHHDRGGPWLAGRAELAASSSATR